MKPTSIIFLIVSVVLLVVGIVTCAVSSNSAEAKGIELLCDKIDKNGNAVTDEELDEFEITDFNISMKDVDINIIGGSKTTYIEFVNINPAIYNYNISNGKMELETISPYKLSAAIDIRENSSPFSGLRSFLYLDKYEGMDAWVNIHVADNAKAEKFTVSLTNGNISVKNIDVDCSYNLSVTKGNVKFENAESSGTAKAVLSEGDLRYIKSAISKLTFKIGKGNAEFICSRQCRLINLKCEDVGTISIDGTPYDDPVTDKIFPIEQQYETTVDNYGEEVYSPLLPVDVEGSVKDGNIIVKNAE